jgi:ubiquinone/menaquinone biosynthesis C-methylase UbiE
MTACSSRKVSTLPLAFLPSVLDVGVGCGIVAAAAAQLVGPTGHVAGIDIRQVRGQEAL